MHEIQNRQIKMKRKVNKRFWVQRQTYLAKNKGYVITRSGIKLPVWMAFRCLYCGEYFSQAEAEEHFGATREEYNSEDKETVLTLEITEYAWNSSWEALDDVDI